MRHVSWCIDDDCLSLVIKNSTTDKAVPVSGDDMP